MIDAMGGSILSLMGFLLLPFGDFFFCFYIFHNNYFILEQLFFSLFINLKKKKKIVKDRKNRCDLAWERFL